ILNRYIILGYYICMLARNGPATRSRDMQDNVVLEIATPNGVFTQTFPKTAKVEEVIAAAVAAQHLAAGDAFDLVHNGVVLQPKQRTLVSFGLAGTVELELVAIGSGV